MSNISGYSQGDFALLSPQYNLENYANPLGEKEEKKQPTMFEKVIELKNKYIPTPDEIYKKIDIEGVTTKIAKKAEENEVTRYAFYIFMMAFTLAGIDKSTSGFSPAKPIPGRACGLFNSYYRRSYLGVGKLLNMIMALVNMAMSAPIFLKRIGVFILLSIIL